MVAEPEHILEASLHQAVLLLFLSARGLISSSYYATRTWRGHVKCPVSLKARRTHDNDEWGRGERTVVELV
ncbi:hypothetical protein B0H65DRAFT_453953 [Neurospora tetraspora]|uniref:Uncharacterized protein n=1 Tax=Neurospora tetraspora TaxID=94610 RepID=A0AAE0JRF7_9PEZI|nr:hypothetical protein B0H65DRAFT_453953 [Neurospora tetraspora]